MNTTPSSTPEMASAYRYLNSPLTRPIPLPIYSQTPPRAFTPDRHLPTYCQTPPRLFTSTRIVTNNEMEQEREVLPSAIDAHTVPIVVARTTGSNEPRDCRLALLESAVFHDHLRRGRKGDVAAQKYVVDLCRDQAGNAVQRGGAHADNWVRQAAQQGHACAQHFLGCLHLIGLVVEHDVVAAETWLEKAAEQDFTPAQLSLGSLNFRKEDYEKSARWFHPAAEKGHVEAQTILGFLHFGCLARRDHDESYKWYRRAADQGFSEAQSALAGCYEFGWGVQEDSSAAHSWYQKAADQGDSRAQFRLGRAYEQGKWGGGLPTSCALTAAVLPFTGWPNDRCQ